ncbi:hypothetical protein AVEN_24820-1 [Araneus ventricosus]|uniref:Uncharacterized protein n=1 Tax=Araneus ventricosus TaxID=182803 RepID=A0A4Y2BTS3_ARAVE|nr:hypothetical protein AVEN_24820-1 [Araneus ventricosus]
MKRIYVRFVNILHYYVKFLDVLTFPANEVAWAEKHGPQPEYQLSKEALFRVLENLHPLQRVQMHVDGDLCLQFVREATDRTFLVRRLLCHPQVVEPLYDLVEKLTRNLPHSHVSFHRVQLG